MEEFERQVTGIGSCNVRGKIIMAYFRGIGNCFACFVKVILLLWV